MLGRSVLAVDDAGVVIQCYPIRTQLETDLVIVQAKNSVRQTHGHHCTKAAFIRKRITSSLHPPMSSASPSDCKRQWLGVNGTHKLQLVQPISYSSLCHCSTNCSSNFCRRRSMMHHSRTPNTLNFSSVVPCGILEPGHLEAVQSLDYCSQQSCIVDKFQPNLSVILWKENSLSFSPIT
ncbi:hypothetical protein TNCV_3143421 [Trichonephila clavipes]|nr:hypothetical protein TNCV_3143421 [Trichonephila clavipes]